MMNEEIVRRLEELEDIINEELEEHTFNAYSMFTIIDNLKNELKKEVENTSYFCGYPTSSRDGS